MAGIRVERRDHLGIVAGVCQEIGLAAYLDALAGPTQQQVSVGTATVAMILNGLDFSSRRLYLVSRFFATKPVEHLLGPGITAGHLHDDCLGRTLDWLHDHDPTALCAGIARQARRRFGIAARQVHVDTTSFAVSGEYASGPNDPDAADAHTIAVTYGYSRDHRADLTQWMLALATTRQAWRAPPSPCCTTGAAAIARQRCCATAYCACVKTRESHWPKTHETLSYSGVQLIRGVSGYATEVPLAR